MVYISDNLMLFVGGICLKFYTYEYGSGKIIDKTYPCIVLVTDDWDDWYKYETLFHARYETEERIVHLGDVKIMTTKGSVTKGHIEDEFDTLDSTFCSLGQTLDYYKIVSELPIGDQQIILNGLRDAAVNDEIADKFIANDCFNESLLRFSEAEKAFKEGKEYFGGKVTKKTLEFSFSYHINGASLPHEVDLDFVENDIPFRINAFVGKNATGKTKILTAMASNLSGVRQNKRNFTPERPSFSKVITISYSAFDELYKPFDDDELGEDKKGEESLLFSYKYCGLRNKKGVLSMADLQKQFIQSFNEVAKRGRQTEWHQIMSNVFEEEHLQKIEELMTSGIHKNEDLSSGQNILLSIITDVIAHIEPDSILLFDEPEIHLHPNAIANFMRMFYEILEKFKSYAIISTHSPIILQEIPSRYVKVFTRISNTPLISMPELECFGESISAITNEIFEVSENESNYKSYLKRLSRFYTKEEIIEMFNDELSFNALTYLNAIYKRKDIQ